ncbi:MAG: hypothetical protein ACI8QZ_000603 [Chlamydiales bacterium]|jgi:hypothetical protein
MDSTTLATFIDGFYGYGAYAAPYWFIGMEEGGCNSFDELEGRVTAWLSRGRQELEDLGDYHAAIGVTKWFGASPSLQRTWSGLIRAAFAAGGVEPDKDAMREYQATRLARHGGETCLLELLPLPAKSIGSWPYDAVGDLGYLRNRAAYMAELLPRRIEHLVSMAREHRPKAIVCYGLGYREHWSRLADNGLEEHVIERKKTLVGKAGGAPLLVMQHPVAHGVTKAYFEAIGRMMAGG